MTFDNSNEVIKEVIIESLSRYQIGLETSMVGSDFVSAGANLLYYKCH